jgi:hypothetical protein
MNHKVLPGKERTDYPYNIIMNTVITIKDLLFFLLASGGIVLFIYLIILISNRIKAIKQTNIMLVEVGTIISAVSEGAETRDLTTHEKSLLKQQVKKVLYFLLL